MLNPYEGVDWSKAQRVTSTTHIHLTCQDHLDNAYRHGIRHFAITNYWPSVPTTPTTCVSDYWLRQDWPIRRHGEPMPLPVNWNEVIDWVDELDEAQKARLPFKETEPMYSSIPEDIAWSPNTEHHGFTDTGAHINALGSNLRTGLFDAGNLMRTADHGINCGYDGPWREAFRDMIDALAYPDGGGVIINHPTWFSRLTDETVGDMLDFDPRVLGIEIYNDYSAKKDWGEVVFAEGRDEPVQGFSLKLWDRILSTGRRCWGFCTPDHSAKTQNWPGRCIVLVDELSDHACLKAYRDGAFVGCMTGEGVGVADLQVDDEAVSVQLDTRATIQFVTQDGTVQSSDGPEAAYSLPRGADGFTDTYVRVEVAHESGERLFLQPIFPGA